MTVYTTTYTKNVYCIRCETFGVCKCGKQDMKFTYSYRLRPPQSTKNKVVFRKFLDDCPQFVNMVTEEQQPYFIELLRKVKYFHKSINGFEWTNIKEK